MDPQQLPSAPKVPLDLYIEATVSYVNNSRSFFLQTADPFEISTFSEELNRYYQNAVELKRTERSIPESDIKEKYIYCVFNQEDKRYYRAQMLRIAYLSSFWVIFVDYGDLKVVPAQFFYLLQSKFQNSPFLAIHCFISDSWIKDCQVLEARFFDVLGNKTRPEKFQSLQVKAKFGKPLNKRFPVSLKVKFPGEDWKNLEEYPFRTDCIPDELHSKFFNFSRFYKSPSLVYTKSNIDALSKFLSALVVGQPALKVEHEYIAVSPYVHSISKFICIIQSFNSSGTIDSNHFTTNLSFFYESLALETDSQLNSLVVFRYNHFYFRGFVLNCTSSNKDCQVLSIDFAFIVNVSLHDIFPLLEPFKLDKVPLFSCLCSLDNIMPACKRWSPLAFQTFREWIQGLKTFIITPRMYLKFTNKMYSVDLKLINGRESATDLLLSDRFGIPMIGYRTPGM